MNKKRYMVEVSIRFENDCISIMSIHGVALQRAGGFPVGPLMITWEGTEEGAELLRAHKCVVTELPPIEYRKSELRFDSEINELIGHTIQDIEVERNDDGIYSVTLAISSTKKVTISMTHAVDPYIQLTLGEERNK